MQYLEHALLGVAFLIFLGVCFAVGAAILIKLVAGRKKPAARPVATVYPIPAAEKGTGQHVSLLDLVDDHIAAEDARLRREVIRDRVYAWTKGSGGSDPKA